MQYRLRAAPA